MTDPTTPTLGEEFLAFMQEHAAKHGGTVRVSPRPVARTVEEEEGYHRTYLVEEVLAGRLSPVWL